MDLTSKKNTVGGHNNPLIARKLKNKETSKRKSLTFTEDEYNRIVALSKTKGEQYKEMIMILIDGEIATLDETESLIYDKFYEKQVK